jgi:hypothetical protein
VAKKRVDFLPGRRGASASMFGYFQFFNFQSSAYSSAQVMDGEELVTTFGIGIIGAVLKNLHLTDL